GQCLPGRCIIRFDGTSPRPFFRFSRLGPDWIGNRFGWCLCFCMLTLSGHGYHLSDDLNPFGIRFFLRVAINAVVAAPYERPFFATSTVRSRADGRGPEAP